MTDTRCDTTDLLTDQCAHCRPPLEKATTGIVHTFWARWSGICAWCEGNLFEGEMVGRDEDGYYVCERCLP